MMNISSECLPACKVACTQPYACSRSLEPCVTSCGDSRAVVFAPPVVLTFPGPTLASCSQESIVGTFIPQPYGAVIQYGSEEPYVVGGSAGMLGKGVSFGFGGSSGIGGSYSKQSYRSLCVSHFGSCGSFWSSLNLSLQTMRRPRR